MQTSGRPSSTLLTQVLLTISYTDQFSYPLSAHEVWLRLVAVDVDAERGQAQLGRCGGESHPRSQRSRLTARQARLPGTYPPELPPQLVDQALEVLKRGGLLGHSRGWYFLAGRSNLSAKRQAKAATSQAKRTEIGQLIAIIKHLPWIQAVALTGSMAMNNADADEDTDVMIITSPGRLWLARLVITAVAVLKGKRRSWSGEEPGSWCFNLWLEASHLSVPVDKRSVYTAYEVVQADFLLSKNMAADAFFQANHWLYHFLPHSSFPAWAPHVPNLLEVTLANIDTMLKPMWSLLNVLSYLVQRWYMRPHQTSERVALGYAYFHPRDTRRKITHGWLGSVKNPSSK